ncbi:MAG: DNA recombination protein RmuC [Ruminococcus sp.]|nr:DNA recombination protein RmuC [Ruminococcus sp.]
MTQDTLNIIILCVAVLSLLFGLVAVILLLKNRNTKPDMTEFTQKNEQQLSTLRQEISASTNQSVKSLGDMIALNQQNFMQSQAEKSKAIEERLKTFSLENEQKLELIRKSVEQKLSYIQEDNNKQLEKMRETVDEKLQKTLEDKMNKSFALVSERLEQVYKGLGEMQNLASGVGDLKKVLSNVKTRGILGEIQLSSILKEILAPEQFDENVATKKGSKDVVEFAIRLPGDDDGFIYLPIDSKFPGDTYAALKDAYDLGDKAQVELAVKTLITTIKREAKDIHDKYIDPPNTTEFAIMFLPFEGLYSEVVNRGLVEVLQRDYRVNIAGPSTMAALLNSIQMGFKTLAVQKRSAEVWEVLGSVKKEFDTFSDVLSKAQQHINLVTKDLDTLAGVRTRQIQRKLSAVQSIDSKVELSDSIDE